MKAGDRIKVQKYIMGHPSHQDDYTVEEFRHCLGIFLSGAHRKAGHFTPLCDLYEPGPDSVQDYIPNYGEYHTNMVQGWMDLPTEERPSHTATVTIGGLQYGGYKIDYD